MYTRERTHARQYRLSAVFVIILFGISVLVLSSLRPNRQDPVPLHEQTFDSYFYRLPWSKQPMRPQRPAVQVDNIFPEINDGGRGDGSLHNNRMLKDMQACLQAQNCGKNQAKVVLLASYHFIGVSYGGFNGGEAIWARSIIKALDALGYTYLYCRSLDHTIHMYQNLPGLVVAALIEKHEADKCALDKDGCTMSPQNPYGIPAWKQLTFSFFPLEQSKLGRKWTLSPEPYHIDRVGMPNNTYVGYSIEETCQKTKFIPAAERPNMIWVLGKSGVYFTKKYLAWPFELFTRVKEETKMDLQLALVFEKHHPHPDVLTVKPTMQQKEFLETISKARVLFGIGMPIVSPTPYDALCLGVPFINPITWWDVNDRNNRRKWETQHNILRYLDPPYVYNVFKDDHEGLIKAVKDAIANPIESYILPRMKQTAVNERMDEILNRDWKAEGKKLREARIEGGHPYLFDVEL